MQLKREHSLRETYLESSQIKYLAIARRGWMDHVSCKFLNPADWFFYAIFSRFFFFFF